MLLKLIYLHILCTPDKKNYKNHKNSNFPSNCCLPGNLLMENLIIMFTCNEKKNFNLDPLV